MKSASKGTRSKRGKKVSKELSEVLSMLAGPISIRRRAAARGLLGKAEFADGFIRCTWWNGCYYCQDIDGKWRVIECYA